MFPDFNLYSSPLLLLSLQGLLFAGLLLKRYLKTKNPSDLFLILILLITCAHQTTYTLGFMSWYDTFKTTKINYFLIDLSLALAPLLYFYFRSVTNPKKVFSKSEFVHFIPMAVYLLIRLVIFIYDFTQPNFNEVQNGYLVTHFQWTYLEPFITLLSMLQMLVYLTLSLQLVWTYREKIKHYFSNTYKVELKWLQTFWVLYAGLFVYNSLQTVIDASIADLSWLQQWWYYMLSGLVIIYIAIKGYFTDLSELKGAEIASFLADEKPLSSQNTVKPNVVEELSAEVKLRKTKIEDYFKVHQPYLESDLTLVSLAEKLECSREELSEAINKGFLLKFNDFINSYRVEAFKTKLAEGLQDQLSLLGIAFECGFNSKATFNRAFKKFTNVSPTQYLNSIK